LHEERQGVEFYFDGKDFRIILSIRSFNESYLKCSKCRCGDDPQM